MKILIIHTFGLGDMIMFTPALQKLVEIYPNAEIDFLIFQKIAAEPIKRFKNLNKLYISDFTLKSILKILLELRKNRYDIILTTSGVNPIKIGFFYIFLKANKKIGEVKKWYHKYFFDIYVSYLENIHRVENNNLLVSNELKTKYPIKFFGIDNHINEIIKKSEKVIIGIHAGSNPLFKLKRWKKEYFVKLIMLLKNKFDNLEFFIFCGPGEIEESEFIAKNTNSKLIKNKNLFEVAKLISKCDIFINTDSGLGHIAGCFDIEIFTIFGPAKDYKAKVYNDKAHVIKLNLECQPCYGTNRIKNCKKFECLNNLTPNYVFNEILKKSKVLNDAK